MTKERYWEGKGRIADEAKDWQHNFSDRDWSYEELAKVWNYFYIMGKRYGVLREFRENGIC